jgi:hypothetical protein
VSPATFGQPNIAEQIRNESRPPNKADSVKFLNARTSISSATKKYSKGRFRVNNQATKGPNKISNFDKNTKVKKSIQNDPMLKFVKSKSNNTTYQETVYSEPRIYSEQRSEYNGTNSSSIIKDLCVEDT